MDKAVSIEPKLAALRLNRSTVYRHAGLLEKAMADIHQAIRLQPQSPKYQKNLALISLLLGKTAQAEQTYLSLTKRFPQYIYGHLDLAQYYMTKNDPSSASLAVEKAAEIEPNSTSVLCWKIRIALLLGKKEQAHNAMKRLEKLKVENQFAATFRAIFLEFDLGKKAAAVATYEHSLEKTLPPAVRMGYLLHLLSLKIRSGQNKGWQKLFERLPQLPPHNFSRSIGKYLLGQMTETQLDKMARSPRQRFHFTYYSGLKAELGDVKRARARYGECARSVHITEYEYIFAKNALKTLGGTQ